MFDFILNSQTQPSRHEEMDTSQQMKRARLSSDTSSDLGKVHRLFQRR